MTLAWRQRALTGPALGAAIALAALALAPAILLADLIDRIFDSTDSAGLVAIAAGLVGVALLDAIFGLGRRLVTARASLRLQRSLAGTAFAKAMRLPMDHPLCQDQGALGQTLEEAEKLAQLASEGLIEALMAAGVMLVLTTALIIVDWPAALAVLSIVSLLAGAQLAVTHAIHHREQRWFMTRSKLWAHVVEVIAYVNTIRFNTAHGYARHRFNELLQHDQDARLATLDLAAMLDAGGRFAAGAIVAAIVLLAGHRVMAGQMSTGDFVLTLTIGSAICTPVTTLARAVQDIQSATVAIARLSQLMLAPAEAIPEGLCPSQRGPTHLVLNGVSFSYPGQAHAVIREVSCQVPAGARLALTGISGVGKSTIASLIVAARRPDAGVILLGGRAIDAMPLGEVRARIILAPHEIDIFSASVFDNIRLGAADVSEDDVASAARAVGLDTALAALPDGLQTMLGQGGVHLSAGQRQRLGIARAIVRRPDILILDESTSSLDMRAEDEVLSRLMRCLPETSIIAITHRPSVVARMDARLGL